MNEEIWKPVAGLEDKYCVSNLGRFYSKIKNKIMSLQTDKDGYLLICLNGKVRRAHRIIAQTFLNNCDNLPQINHKDGNKSNNNITNLEWCTASYNMKHRFKVLKQVVHNKGKRQSEETKQKISCKNKGRNMFGDNVRAKKVMCVETGKIFSSATEADKFLGFCKGGVSHCLEGLSKTSGGFHWQFV